MPLPTRTARCEECFSGTAYSRSRCLEKIKNPVYLQLDLLTTYVTRVLSQARETPKGEIASSLRLLRQLLCCANTRRCWDYTG